MKNLKIKYLVLFLIVVFIFSCQKQNLNDNKIEFIKNNLQLIKKDFKSENNLIGDLYSYKEDQDVFILHKKQQLKTYNDPIEPTGTLVAVSYEWGVKLSCEGSPDDCTILGDYLVIFKD